MRKTELAIERCKTISTLQKILGGKWKIEILYYIAIRDIHRATPHKCQKPHYTVGAK